MNLAMDLIREALLGGSGGGGGGGGDSFQLIYSDHLAITTTSTSAKLEHTIDDVGVDIKNIQDKILYTHIYDRNGRKDGYFYGQEEFSYRKSSSEQTVDTYVRIRGNSGDIVVANGGPYGVYTSFPSSGKIWIYSKYNAANGGTTDGDYQVDIYLVDMPKAIYP